MKMGKNPLFEKDEKGLHQLHELSEKLQAPGKTNIIDPLNKKGKQ